MGDRHVKGAVRGKDGGISRRRLLQLAAYSVPAMQMLSVAASSRALAHSPGAFTACTWKEYDPLAVQDGWSFPPYWGCVPTSVAWQRTMSGYLHFRAGGGAPNGTDCVGLNTVKTFPLPSAGITKLEMSVHWRVPEFSSGHGKTHYADLLLIPRDGGGAELGRLRYRVSCDDVWWGPYGICTPPNWGVSDGSTVISVATGGVVLDWQQLFAVVTDDLPGANWSAARSLEANFEFTAGWMYGGDVVAVDWRDLVLCAN